MNIEYLSLIWLFDLLHRSGGGYGGHDRRDRYGSSGGRRNDDDRRDRSKLSQLVNHRTGRPPHKTNMVTHLKAYKMSILLLMNYFIHPKTPSPPDQRKDFNMLIFKVG